VPDSHLLLWWVDDLPVVFHADDGPPSGDRLVPSRVELLQLVDAIVRVLTFTAVSYRRGRK
jgi:hypothetical protein